MSSKPEDKPKIIALLVAVVAVLAYVLITFIPKLMGGSGAQAAAAPPPPPPLATASAVAPAGNATIPPSGDASAALPDDDTAPVTPPPSHDSFTPPPASRHGSLEAVQAIPVKPPAPIAPPPAAQAAAKAAPGVTGAGMAPAAPALPAIEVKGVILGDPALAVLSVNGEVIQRQVGDSVGGGLKLVQIVEAGVVLQDAKHKIPVSVGHAMPAATPMQPVLPAVEKQPGK